MTARDQFKKGDRVRHGRIIGTVIGYGHGENYVRVLHDGRRTAETWHISAWGSAMTPAEEQQRKIEELEAERDKWKDLAEVAQRECADRSARLAEALKQVPPTPPAVVGDDGQ